MTEIEKNNIVQMFKDISTAKQINFCITYLRNNKHIPTTAKELHTSPQNLYLMLKSKQVLFLIKLMELTITEGSGANRKETTPTLEYLSEQWDYLYQRAKDIGDDKTASQILDKRMKYYEMFEELRKEDKINLSKLTINELISYENDRHLKTMDLLTKGKQNEWKELVENVVEDTDDK